MRPISIDDAMARTTVDIDLFVKLSDFKFVMIVKAGMPCPVEHLEKFKAKNVFHLWVRASDFALAAEKSISVAGMIVGKARVADVSKLAILGNATAAVFREAETCGFNSVTLGHSKMVVEATIGLAESQPVLAGLLEKLALFGQDSTRHAMSTSLISVILGIAHDWTSSTTLEKLALGGMFHDLGKLKLPRDLLTKSLKRMSRDELTIYRSHPELGREILAMERTIPEDVMLIVAQHHERSDGTGFPAKIRDLYISPLARVVALANEISEAITRLVETGKPVDAKRISDDIHSGKPGHFNRDALRALARAVQPPGESNSGSNSNKVA